MRRLMTVGLAVLCFANSYGQTKKVSDTTKKETPFPAKELEEVKVSSRKNPIELKADRIVVNVSNSVNATGSDALELLRKSPGVVVDKDDNIQLNGKAGVQIWIDGRPSPLSPQELAQQLRSMQASDIESIELIANPDAKFDAAGTAGIINIKMKKNKSYGTNGSVTAGYAIGTYGKYNGSLTLNHRNEKFNAFGTLGGNAGLGENYFNLHREQNDSLYDAKTTSKNKWINSNVKAGVDYFINSKHTIGVLINTFNNNSTNRQENVTPISSIDMKELSRTLIAVNETEDDRNNYQANLNYRYADTNGTELTMDADYGLYLSESFSDQPNSYYSPSGDLIAERNYQMNRETDINVYTFKADYSRKLGKGKMGLGGKVSYVKTDNDFKFYNVPYENPVIDPDRSNRFIYKENINALYANYNIPVKKWGFQAGLRAEQTISKGSLESSTSNGEEVVDRNYIDLFPSASVSRQLGKNNQLNLTYSRRIDRPQYNNLNPFEYKLDELTYMKGNPFLKPQYTQSFGVTHLYKSSLNTSLTYAYTKDFFTGVTDTTENNRSFLTTKNLANRQVWALNVSSPFNITKWWSGYASGGLSYIMNNADFGGGKTIDLNIWNYNMNAQMTFTLPKAWSIELTGWYYGPGVWGGTFETGGNGALDVGVQKRLFKDKGNLKMVVTDIFYTNPWNATSRYGGLYLEANGGWESRQFRVSYTHRFGKQSVKGERKRATGLDEESKRI